MCSLIGAMILPETARWFISLALKNDSELTTLESLRHFLPSHAFLEDNRSAYKQQRKSNLRSTLE